MMKQIITALAFAAVLVPAANAHELVQSAKYPGLEGHMDGGYFRPTGVEGPAVPNADEIFAFIQAHSPKHTGLHPEAGEDIYTIDGIELPVVRYLNEEQMEIFVGPGMGEEVALYEEGYMYLNPNIDFSNDEDLSVYVHELVHHVQWFSGENEEAHYQSCPMHLERDAYRIQLAWMETADVSDDWVYNMQLNKEIQGSTLCYADRPFG